jgi:hypothetical protein
MPGRHQAVSRRGTRLRWLAGVAGGAVIGAIILATTAASAGASVDPVKATFGVTGVATSNCPVSVGGTDVYVTPGQELDVKSSLAGIYVNGYGLLSDLLGSIASLNGSLVIDPGTDHAQKFDIKTTAQQVGDLADGNHHWKWTVSSVKLLGGLLTIPLSLTSSALNAGAQLTWEGTIHVTSDAAQCGVAVALPSVSASVSVTGLPPIQVGIPGVTVGTLPVKVPTSLPTGLPTGAGSGPSGHKSTAPADQSNPIPVPARVVPGPNGSGLLGGGFNTAGLPGSGGGAAQLGGGALAGSSNDNPAAPILQQDSTGKHKTIDLAAGRPSSTGEVWVVLAIVAVIALAFVAATYARLYLIKHES